MKTMTFKYRPKSKAKLLSDMKKAIAGKAQVHDDIIYFENLDDVNSFLSPVKAKIIRAIQKNQPQSIYELAQILDLDSAYIQREAKLLAKLGIIELKSKIENGRTKSVPTVVYDKFIIDLGEVAESKVV